MNEEYTIQSTQYFTATIYEWHPLLADNMHKDIIIEVYIFGERQKD
jgi:hypothetical protein